MPQVLCEAGDWIRVPAGTTHRFAIGPEPPVTAIRFIDNPEGWLAQFTGDPITGDPIADRFPLLEAAAWVGRGR